MGEMGKQLIRRIQQVRFPKGYAVELDKLMADIWAPESLAYQRHKRYLEHFWEELCKVRTAKVNVTKAKYATADHFYIGHQSLNDTIRPLVEHLDDLTLATTSPEPRQPTLPTTDNQDLTKLHDLLEIIRLDLSLVIIRQKEIADALAIKLRPIQS